MKNQSFYAAIVTLLVLIAVAIWQFASLMARSEGLREQYTVGDPRALDRPTPAAKSR